MKMTLRSLLKKQLRMRLTMLQEKCLQDLLADIITTHCLRPKEGAITELLGEVAVVATILVVEVAEAVTLVVEVAEATDQLGVAVVVVTPAEVVKKDGIFYEMQSEMAAFFCLYF